MKKKEEEHPTKNFFFFSRGDERRIKEQRFYKIEIATKRRVFSLSFSFQISFVAFDSSITM